MTQTRTIQTIATISSTSKGNHKVALSIVNLTTNEREQFREYVTSETVEEIRKYLAETYGNIKVEE